ncbi:hypothetical protein F2Q69_00038521 [Brassica cretica]|uniref:RNA-dependent RNA polymerase n=1 Tax=Brassica cretica TaxID=69181 RepID=A0A8S9SNJ9_BRACR|nr:hypothetical protein F2Q69_00038521 [Brassica cretica]
MFAPWDGIKAEDIRSWMDDFGNIKNVVKYVARLGQSFGLSKETLTIMADDVELFLMWRSSLQEHTMCFQMELERFLLSLLSWWLGNATSKEFLHLLFRLDMEGTKE